MRSFTFQGMVIPGSVEVVVNKGDTRVVKVGRNYFLFFFGKGLGRCVLRPKSYVSDLDGLHKSRY